MLGFNIPYGYDYVNGNLVENKAESPQVRKIFELYLAGQSMDKIALRLNEEGIPSKQKKKWGPHTVQLILRNPLYYGFLRWEKYLNKGDYPPLIDQNTFSEVQEIIKKRKTIHRHHTKKVVVTAVKI